MIRTIGAIFLLTTILLAVGCDTGPTECSIGISGTKASVTVKGPKAGQMCDQILTNRRDSFGARWAPNLYELTQPPSEPVICEYRDRTSGLRVVVRDEGPRIGDLVFSPSLGPSICESLRQSQ